MVTREAIRMFIERYTVRSSSGEADTGRYETSVKVPAPYPIIAAAKRDVTKL
jgi:hypothetical protein